MEPIKGSREVSKLSTKDDIISSMPDIVITHILNLLPIQDAVRTSILARNWRFKWTTLTQLVFDEDFVEYLFRLYVEGNDNWYDERIISNLLIHLKGPITKFFLHVPNEKELNVKDLHHWVLILSRKGIMEFTLENCNGREIELPTDLFSCLELTHLKLYNCHFYSVPTFGSFPNLLSLDLSWVTFASDFCEIITLCPRLEILVFGNDLYADITSKLKLVEIAKLKNLKMLSFPLRALDSTPIINSLIFDLRGYFPKLQELDLSFLNCKFVEEAVLQNLLRDSFSSVKTLTLNLLDFSNSIMLAFAFEIIWGCPNLQTLSISASCEYTIPSLALHPSDLDYITMGQLPLLNVVVDPFRGSKNELLLIKNLLAYTPLLKKITICVDPDPSLKIDGYKEERLMLAVKLLRLPRASTVAEVDLQLS